MFTINANGAIRPKDFAPLTRSVVYLSSKVFQIIISHRYFSGNSELIAATFKDRNGRHPVISGSYFDDKMQWQILTTQRDIMNLNGMALSIFCV